MDLFDKSNEDNAIELAAKIMDVFQNNIQSNSLQATKWVEFMVALTYLLAYICDTMTKSGLKEDKLRIADEFSKLVKSKIERCDTYDDIFH